MTWILLKLLTDFEITAREIIMQIKYLKHQILMILIIAVNI